TGTRYQGIRARETLQAAVAASGYRTPKAPNVGRGVAMGERPPAGGESHAAVTLNPDGSVIIHTSIFEPGTGTYTLLRQIVAEALGAARGRQKVDPGHEPFSSHIVHGAGS